MTNDIFTPSEKATAKKVGKVYLRIIKAMGTFFLLGLILSAATVATADPAGWELHLDAGESAEFPVFFGEAGDDVQLTYFIIEMSGQPYVYEMEESDYDAYYQDEHYSDYIDEDDVYYTGQHRNHMEDPVDLLVYMQNMENYLSAKLLYSTSLEFENVQVVKILDGEVMVSEFDLVATGFYKWSITNQHSEDLFIGFGTAQANLMLAAAAVTAWVFFGLAVSFFGFAVHVGVWILVIYIIVKALKIIQEDNRRTVATQQQVIGPEI